MKPDSSSSVDWDEIKRRISELGKTLALAETVTASEAQTILRQRAQRLAESTEQHQQTDSSIEVMIVRLAGERYALETTLIREVIQPSTLTPLPGTESFIAGMMNRRGRPLLIVDGRELLELAAEGLAEPARIIVIGDAQAEFGLMTDATEEVATLDIAEIVDPPDSLPDSTRRLMRGVTPCATIVLDMERLRDDPRLWIDEQDD